MHLQPVMPKNESKCSLTTRVKIRSKFKYKQLIYLCFINFIGLLMLGYHYPFTSNNPIPERLHARNHITKDINCSVRENILFLKTHKTASSTVQNIFMRFGLRRSLNFLLPKKHNYIGYKRPIDDHIDLDKNLTPPDNKFNIFAHHSRYCQNTNAYLHNDTFRVTILRYPPQHFESMYDYFKLPRYYGMSLRELLATLPHTNVSFVRKKRLKNGFNQMSFDLGLETHQMENQSAVRDFVDYVDAQFDYVMITEYMEASLVMLADLLSWPLEYVSFVPLMKRNALFKYRLTSADELKISALNKADTMLYDHFLEKFRQRVLRYGFLKLTDNMKRLRRINEELYNSCIHSTNWSGYSSTIGYRLTDPSNWHCVHATKSELYFTTELRQEQTDRLKAIKNVYELINNGPQNRVRK